jgi:hypothetical protein
MTVALAAPSTLARREREEVNQMKRAVISKHSIAAMLVAGAALAAGSVAGAGHSAPAPAVGTALMWCPPMC